MIKNKNKNERTLWNLALYLYKSFSRHKVIMFWSVPYAKLFTWTDHYVANTLYFLYFVLIIDSKYVCIMRCWRNDVQTYHFCICLSLLTVRPVLYLPASPYCQTCPVPACLSLLSDLSCTCLSLLAVRPADGAVAGSRLCPDWTGGCPSCSCQWESSERLGSEITDLGQGK